MEEYEDLAARLQKVERSNARLGTVVNIVVVAILVWIAFLYFTRGLMQPSVEWRDGKIHIFTYDGTNVFTHAVAETDAGRIYGALEPPRVRFESGSFDIDPNTLVWLDERGEKATPPLPGAKVTAAYFRGERITRAK